MAIDYGVIFACVCGVILAVGFYAYILVFSLFAKYNSLRKNRLDILLLSMAVADFLTLILMPFIIFSSVNVTWTLGEDFCKIFQFSFAFSLAASIYSLSAVSFTRARVIMMPHQPPEMTTIVFMLIFIWTSSFFVSLALRINATLESTFANTTFCLPSLYQYHSHVVITQFILFYFIPMLVIGYNYIRLAVFLHKSPMMSLVSSRNTRRASALIFSAAAIFSACWLPGYIFELCVYLGCYWDGYGWNVFHFICTILQYLSPCINPVLYVLLSKRYRNGKISWILHCKKTRIYPQISSLTENS
ncbi:galanin receptor 2a [Latimeria chalumnae]|uniref:galanin receptor 2a n=1 Tax=Latimeria chalumnae TaxID=7897 RepID=UPI00313DAC72